MEVPNGSNPLDKSISYDIVKLNVKLMGTVFVKLGPFLDLGSILPRVCTSAVVFCSGDEGGKNQSGNLRIAK